MEQKLSIDVTCETQEIAAKYEELSRKMLNDKEFQEALKLCKSDREIYDLYTKHGYTDLSFEDFSKEFSSIMEQMLGSNDASTMELTTEELENVVGGFNFFRFIILHYMYIIYLNFFFFFFLLFLFIFIFFKTNT